MLLLEVNVLLQVSQVVFELSAFALKQFVEVFAPELGGAAVYNDFVQLLAALEVFLVGCMLSVEGP